MTEGLNAPLTEPFAHATLEKNCLVVPIGPGNSGLGVGRVPLAEALSSGQAFCGPVKPGLVALDVDSRDDLERAELFSRAHPEVVFVKFTSGGGNKFGDSHEAQHWWGITPAGMHDAHLRKMMLHASIRKGQIRASGMGRDMRPPLSPHTNGGYGRALNMATEEALYRLQQAGSDYPQGDPPEPVPDTSGPIVVRRALSEKGCRVARLGQAAGFDSRTRACRSLAFSMHHAGWEYGDFLAFLKDRDMAVGEKYREIAATNQSKADKLAYGWWKRPPGFSPSSSGPLAKEAIAQLSAVIDAANGWPYWKLDSKDSCVWLLEILVRLALRHNSLTVCPGNRGLSEESCLSEGCVHDNLKQLANLGWVDIHSPNGRDWNEAERITLNLDKGNIPAGVPYYGPQIGEPGRYLPSGSDVWTKPVLGPVARVAYLTLAANDGPMSVAQIAAATRKTEKPIRQALRLLLSCQTADLVTCSTGGQWEALTLSEPKAAEVAIIGGSDLARHRAAKQETHHRQRMADKMQHANRVPFTIHG